MHPWNGSSPMQENQPTIHVEYDPDETSVQSSIQPAKIKREQEDPEAEDVIYGFFTHGDRENLEELQDQLSEVVSEAELEDEQTTTQLDNEEFGDLARVKKARLISKLDQSLIDAVDKLDVDAVTKALEDGANVMVRNPQYAYITPLMRLFDIKNKSEIAKVRSIVSVLLAHEDRNRLLGVRAYNKKKQQAIHLAAIFGDSQLMSMLLEAGADAHAYTFLKGKHAYNVLSLAVKCHQVDVVRLLLTERAYSQEELQKSKKYLMQGFRPKDIDEATRIKAHKEIRVLLESVLVKSGYPQKRRAGRGWSLARAVQTLTLSLLKKY